MIRFCSMVIGQAIATLREHPMRSLLTALTVTFGTAVLMVLVSYGAGAPAATTAVLQQMGSTQIRVSPRRMRGMGGSRSGRQLEIRYEDLDAIRDACPSIGAMAAGFSAGMGGPTYSPTRSWPWARLYGVGHEFREVADLHLVDGRWFRLEEEIARDKLAVLNLPLAEGLFPGESAIGQWIESGGRRFEVIGVLLDAEAFAYSFYVPFTAAIGLGDEGGRAVEFLTIKPVRQDLADEAIRQLKDALAARYRFDADDDRALRVEEQTEFIGHVNAVSTGLQGLVLTVALVALVLGCLGAANVVGITVAERSSEIGLRKALGATPFHIQAEVLAESVVLCVGGGGLGVLMGAAAVRVLGPIKLGLSIEVAPRADLPILFFGFGVLILVGTLAGLPAAGRAASLDPASSLHE